MGQRSKAGDEDVGIFILIVIAIGIAAFILKVILAILFNIFMFIIDVLLYKNVWLNINFIWYSVTIVLVKNRFVHNNLLATFLGGCLAFSIAILVEIIAIFVENVDLSISKIPLVLMLSLALISYYISENRDKKYKIYLQTVPGLFDNAKSLSAKANSLFQKKKCHEALKNYEDALIDFNVAGDGAKSLKDKDLVNTIFNNTSTLKKNIVNCNNAIGGEIASKAKKQFEKGNFLDAIGIYEDSLNFLQDSEIITNIKSNLESCYIEIDREKIEELSNRANSLLEEATNINKPFEARDKLKEADNTIYEAITIAKKRNFTIALQQLNTISKEIFVQRNIIDEQLSGGMDEIVYDKSAIETINSVNKPTINTEVNNSTRITSNSQVKLFRGYEISPNNDLRFGIRAENNSSFAIMDLQVILDYPKTLFSVIGGDIQNIGNINPTGKRTATFILKPLGCIHNEQINALITYKDHTGKKQTLHMHPKEVHCVCPFLKEKSMSEGEYGRLAGNSEFIQEGISFKGISIDELANFMGETCKHMLYKVREYDLDGKKIIYLSGESLGEKAYYLLTVVVQEYKGATQVVLRAHSDKKYGLNGFMNEMADSIRHLVGSVQGAKEIGIIENNQVINIIDSIVQRTNFEMRDGGNTQVNIKDSVVQRSDIGKDK